MSSQSRGCIASRLTCGQNRIMTHHFINSAISVSLKSAMCYLHCATNIDNNVVEKFGTFEPEPGTFCRPQCWQNWDWDQTQQLKMFGLDTLMNENNHWGINAQEFLTNSYNHWRWSRFSPDIMFPTVDQLREGTTSNSTSGAALPVCYSPQSIKLHEPWGDGSALPCVCGDEIGNETISFFRETNFRSWVAAEKGKGVAEACQSSFRTDKTLPVQAYLAFCHLGWHFPVEDDKHSHNSTNKGKHRFALGADVMCEQAEKEAREVMERGGSSTDVNCNLCWLSQTGKTIKENQRSYVHHKTHGHHNKYNFERACEEQMDKKRVCKIVT